MPKVAFGRSAYRRDKGNLPELRLVNMFVEEAKASELGFVLQSRPGLVTVTTLATSPVEGMFSRDGVFSGARFAVAGGQLYRGTTALGAIGGNGPCSFAGSETELIAARGGGIVRTGGGAVTAVSFPDGAGVVSVAYLGGYFLAARSGGQQFYWSTLFDATAWDGADYASAESSPDGLVELVVVSDELWLIGQATIEVWVQTGDSALPFVRAEGRIYRKGAYGTGCARELDNTLFWVGDDRIVYRGGQVPQRVSDNGIEERIADSTTVETFTFLWEGHSFFCVRLDAGTFAYDVATGEWCELASYGAARWGVSCATMVGDVPQFGSDTTGAILAFAGDNDNGAARECLFSAAAPIEGGGFIVNNIRLSANVGRTGRLTGTEANPQVELRASNDAGATWGEWEQAELGGAGDFRARTEWRRLGLFDDPGALFEMRTTADAPYRVSGVAVNAAGGGRSR